MNAAVAPDSPVGRAARAWALAVQGGDFAPEQSERLRAWLDADPAHRPAYEQAEAVILLLVELQASPRSLPARRVTSRLRAPAFVAAGALLAAACVAVVVLGPATRYETRAGEVRHIGLRDGSRVTLGPASRMKAGGIGRSRRLALEQGEAFFNVAHQDGRAFVVRAGPTTVRVMGTRFDVHQVQDDTVRVAVEQGAVLVADARLKTSTGVTLRAGQQTVADGGRLVVSTLAEPGLAGAWRQGRLAYDDVDLSEVIADLNRYRGRSISVGSKAAGRLKVTAAFEVANIDQFVANLPRILPVHLQSDGRGGLVVNAVQGAPPASDGH